MQDAEVAFTALSFLSAIIGLLAAIIGRKKVIEIRHVADTPAVSRHPPARRTDDGRKWYDKTFWLIFWLILFWPVGIYALFKNRSVGTGWKITIVVLWLLLLAAAMAEP